MRIIHVLRKPISEGTVSSNVLKHGVGAYNIDASRVGAESRSYRGSGVSQMRYTDGRAGLTDGRGRDLAFSVSGRWPANVILQHPDPIESLEEQAEGSSHFFKKVGGE